VVNHAFGLELVTLMQLLRYTGRGAKKLRRILADAAPTKSELENLVLELLLEADSRRFHGNMIARADDATRQLVLETMGLRVIRTTWREATTRPAVVQRRVAEALSSTSST
jgi:hypothetical protein